MFVLLLLLIRDMIPENVMNFMITTIQSILHNSGTANITY